MKSTLAIACLSVLLSATLSLADPPTSWSLTETRRGDYEISLDRAIVRSGKASGTIRSIRENPEGVGALRQESSSEKFQGKRLRFRAWIRTQKLAGSAGLWLRVNGMAGRMLGYDGMRNRPLKGTLDWTRCEIVLDVPEHAINIDYGILIYGAGQAWLDDAVFEIVGKDVPVTSVEERSPPPANLDFED